MYLFLGFRDHKIDGKDRIVVPTGYASEIRAQGQGILVLVPSANGLFLEAYPSDVFKEMSQGQVPSRFLGAQDEKRVFFQNAEPAPLKGPGRITLPKKFLSYFPNGVVRVGGMNTYLELWDPELWEKNVGSPGAHRAGRPSAGHGRESKG